MTKIVSLDQLEALYQPAPAPASTAKVAHAMTPDYRRLIEVSPFAALATIGPEGLDCSPRGDKPGFVRIHDDKTLMLPDRRGNNRIDSLRNIVRDGRVSLMLMVPGANNVIRINGTAVLSADPAVTETFEQRGKHPKSVIVITVAEAYFQCAKAIMRSDLWGGDAADGLPTAGQMIKEQQAEFDGQSYDDNYAEYAKTRMW